MSPAAHRAFMLGAVLLDLVIAGGAIFATALLRFDAADVLSLGGAVTGSVLIALAATSCVAFLSAGGAYAPRVLVTRRLQVATLLTAVIPAWALIQLIAFWLKVEIPFESRLVVGVSLPVTLILLVLGRLLITRPAARRVYARLTRGSVLVLGSPEAVAESARDLRRLDLAGRHHDARPLDSMHPSEAPETISRHGYGEVVILANGEGADDFMDLAFACLDSRAEVKIVSERFQNLRARAPLPVFDGRPMFCLRRGDLAGPEVFVKRTIDILGSAFGLVLLSPFFALVALIIRLDSPGPVMFRQERVGRGGRKFGMLKLRTMKHGNSAAVHQDYLKRFIEGGAPAEVRSDGTKVYKLTNDDRITRVGGWLRRYSLDELPQLWNVLCGEMSLVGPRPCTAFEWDLHRPWQQRRMDVLPGCTGLWQVTGRSKVSFEEMVLLDLHYVHTWTPVGDLRLIAQTVPAMIRGSGGF